MKPLSGAPAYCHWPRKLANKPWWTTNLLQYSKSWVTCRIWRSEDQKENGSDHQKKNWGWVTVGHYMNGYRVNIQGKFSENMFKTQNDYGGHHVNWKNWTHSIRWHFILSGVYFSDMLKLSSILPTTNKIKVYFIY